MAVLLILYTSQVGQIFLKEQNQIHNMGDEDQQHSRCVDVLDVCESMGTLPPTEMARTWQNQANQACCSAAWILVPSKLSSMK